jgi:signal peptidase I
MRQVRKLGKTALRHSKHLRNYREDVAAKAELDDLAKCEAELSLALCGDDEAAIESAAASVMGAASSIASKKRHSGLRENLEILVVAIAVAMGIRTYFVQPFKIPTGSMQPTLYGINGAEGRERGLTDRFPLSTVRWLITGERYREVRVTESGRLQILQQSSVPGLIECRVGRKKYFVPKSDRLLMMDGMMLSNGALLWQGRQKAGDHVFVNKVVWNFMKPRRGDVMVFYTTGIRGLPQGTHYIKRMCGLPTETVGIDPPNLIVNGNPASEPESIMRVVNAEPGYFGYQLARPAPEIDPVLMSADARVKLSEDEYLALGDNTQSSFDSRYWGAVPRANLVGPAFFLYWPYTPGRWGFITGH